jgi:DNA polymerase-1
VIQPAILSVKEVGFGGVVTPQKSKLSKKEIVSELTILHNWCETYGVKIIAVGVADMFKYLSGGAKFTLNFGKALPGAKIKVDKDNYLDFSDYTIIPFLNPVVLNQYPQKVTEVARGLSIIKSVTEGTYSDSVSIDMKVNEIITDPQRAVDVLKKLFTADVLTSDIETTGLDWYRHHMLTLSLSPNEDEAYCFALHDQYYDNPAVAAKVREYVGRFLKKYSGILIGHNFTGFDIPFIVHMLRDQDFSVPHEPLITKFTLIDTVLMAYLLKNSTERASIGLKELSFKYMGEYDADIDQKNLASAPLEKVATYNNLDCRATWLVYKELKAAIIEEGFEDVFEEFNGIAYDLAKMKMHGLRIDMPKVKQFQEELKNFIAADKKALMENSYVKQATELTAKYAMRKYNATRVGKKTDWTEFVSEFNPNSPAQKKLLFFDLLDLPIIKKSNKTGDPSTDAATIEAWLESDDIPEYKKEVVTLLSEYMTAQKIQSTYITTMVEKAVEVAPNDFRMFTNFNQTATITGRLSSSGDINLQTIPNSSKYGKRVKELFIAPDGFVLGAADYNALEDRLIANESKDQNKLNIFLKNIDGHSLNAYGYFKDEFKARGLEFDVNDPESINQIKKLAPDLRQKGKPYTFGFSYGAGPKKYGQDLYEAYWETYYGVKKYNDNIIRQAMKDGYLISRFSGLRLLLPAINAKDEFVQSKEFRVACNFSIQSGNFLMLRAIHNMQKWIEDNNLIADVKLVLTVHDSVYLYIKEDAELIKKVNSTLTKFMAEPYSDDQILPLPAELDVGYDMLTYQTLSNDADEAEIEEKLAIVKQKKEEGNE